MTEQCPFCGNKHMTPKKTRYLYQHDDRLLIVNDVPCLECDYCGETYFEAAVLKKIENEFEGIESQTKEPQRVIEVPVEDFAAI